MAPGDELYRHGRYSFGKKTLKGLRTFFEDVDWREFSATREMHKKWETFLNLYNSGIKKYVPRENERTGKKTGSTEIVR